MASKKTKSELRKEDPSLTPAQLKQAFKNQSDGLGDRIERAIPEVVKKAVKAVADDCGCDDRQKRYNKKYPNRGRKMVRCFTLEMSKEWSSYIKNRSLKSFTESDIQMIIRIYKHVFAVAIDNKDLCRTCNSSAKLLIKYSEQLDKVFQENDSI